MMDATDDPGFDGAPSKPTARLRVEAELRLRNGHIREALVARGWNNADLARATGFDQAIVGLIVNMKLKKFRWDSRPGRAAMAIAKALGLQPDEVVPPSVIGRDVEVARAIGEVSPQQLERMAGVCLLPSGDEGADDRLDAEQRVAEVLERLSPRRAAILRARFGVGEEQKTLREVSAEAGMSCERVRQIETGGSVRRGQGHALHCG